ncbi:MAG TPA: pyridoxamine 5'-phosphate oxidase family protein [Methanocorpusculum sp.]|nr:pyridoxamine 5'-phosphate oxidase family protein [Methanocorpusculum sp.]
MSVPFKIPKMLKAEYDQLIRRNVISRIAFSGAEHPYIAPFLYVFDEKHLYFLSTRYGKKMKLFAENPLVSVEIEEVAPDMSNYKFVTLLGKLVEVTDAKRKLEVKTHFVQLITEKKISENSLQALGHSPADPPNNIVVEDRMMVWQLVDVKEIVALKNA